jgi:hypothetical protein
MTELRTEILSAFIEQCGLLPETRQHLKERRMLPDTIVDESFLSGAAERVIPSVDALRERYGDGDLAACGLLEKNDVGEMVVPSHLTQDRPLIVYRKQNGSPYFLRPHKHFAKGAAPRIFGQQSVQDAESPVIVTEGEFKAAVLHGIGFPALSLPGVSAFAAQHYQALLRLLQTLGVKQLVLCYDNADRTSRKLPNGQDNPKYVDEPAKRYDVEYWQVFLGRRLAADGLHVRHARLPDRWRDPTTGEADIDGVLAERIATEEQLARCLEGAADQKGFLELLPAAGKSTILAKLKDGVLEERGAAGFSLSSFPFRLIASDLKKGAHGLRGQIDVEVNYRSVHSDRFSIDNAKARQRFAKEAIAAQAEMDTPTVEDGEKRLKRLVDNFRQQIAKHLRSAAKAGAEERKRHREQTHRAVDAYIGQSTYRCVPRGLLRDVGEDDFEHIANFYMTVERDVTVDNGLQQERTYEAAVHKKRHESYF